jgi:ribosome-binding protein aMBF1 (putative translation factor)
MTKKSRVHRPRVQTPEQEAAEDAIRQQFHKERPTLQTLVDRGDISEVFTMGEYWELKKTLAAFKAAREQQGLSVSELAQRTGMDEALINRLESGHVDNLAIVTMTRYAKALGKKVVVGLVDAK